MVPGIQGDLGILENHEPFMTPLRDGIIWGRLHSATGKILAAAIMGGYVQVLGSRVIVLCDKTRALELINFEKARDDIKYYKDKLSKLSPDDFILNSYYTRKLRWSETQYHAKLNEDKFKI